MDSLLLSSGRVESRLELGYVVKANHVLIMWAKMRCQELIKFSCNVFFQLQIDNLREKENRIFASEKFLFFSREIKKYFVFCLAR